MRGIGGRPILGFAGVTAGYGSTSVFRNLSFSVSRGEGLCLLGRNGCGKSTVLRSALRLATVSSGVVQLDGREVNTIPRNGFAQLGVGYVPQGRGNFLSLTVKENIRLAAVCGTRLPWAGVVDRVFGQLPAIVPLRSRTIGQLSGGERTLVALARALALGPALRLLLLDELSSGLSSVNKQFVGALLIRLLQDGTAILMAEQDLAFAKSLSLPLMEPLWSIDTTAVSQEVF